MTTDGMPPAARVRGPRWRDARLVVGLLLVLVSVAVGVQIFRTADRTTAVWAAARDLDSGAVLAADDLVQRRARLLESSSEYVSGARPPVGYVVVRPVGAGELVPRGALVAPSKAPERRLVTVPVSRGHLPAGLAAGQRVDVYVTPTSRSGDTEPAALVAASAVVADVGDAGGRLGSATADVSVVLSVPPDLVPGLVDAVRHGDADLVRIPLGSTATASPQGSGSP